MLLNRSLIVLFALFSLIISVAYAETDEKPKSCTVSIYAGADSENTTTSSTDEDNKEKKLWEIPETWINGIYLIDENSKMRSLTNNQLFVCVDGNKIKKNKVLITQITLPDCSEKAELVLTGVMGIDKECPPATSPSTGSLGRSNKRFILLSKCFKDIYNIGDNQVFQTITPSGVENGMYKRIVGLWDHTFDTDLCKDKVEE